jgi:hypothetical protein
LERLAVVRCWKRFLFTYFITFKFIFMAASEPLRNVGRAIKWLDEWPSRPTNYGSIANCTRIDEARKNLINVLFSMGYELKSGTYTVVKSKEKRKLV